MKNIFKTLILLGLVASSTSCKKYLDVNTNPNDVTAATPDIILPQALTATAALSYTYAGPAYGMDLGGYIANAGGIGGFGNFWTFVFNSGDATNVWGNTFDNLQDYQYILNNTTSTGDQKYFNAVARLMKAYDYLKLVDAYGDVPYTNALQGAANLQPKYDKGEDVYKACITEIDNAIAQFKSASTPTTTNIAAGATGKIDVTVYSGNATPQNPLSGTSGLDMTNWIKFANTLKLRSLLHIQKVTSLAAFYTTEKATMAALTSADFVSSDVLVNPGYVQQSGKQNPLWNAFAYTYTGTNSTKNYLPSTFATAFYNGTKLVDDGRGKIIYRDYTHNNQLGFQSTSLPANPTGGQWYTGSTSAATANLSGLGVMKGYDMGQPLIMASESYFLQAEGALVGLTPAVGAVDALFNNGVLASFTYLDKDHTDVVSSTRNPTTEVATYKTNNATSYLVNSTLWATPVAGDYNTDVTQRTLEAIITQKYIALNMLNCDEAWTDYRRTYNANLKGGTLKSGYPISDPAGDASHTFAPSFQTNTSPRADKLAGRIIYPASEYSYNTSNVPSVNTSTSLIFNDARPTN